MRALPATLLLASCAGFVAPPPGLVERVERANRSVAPALREAAVVEIRSDGVTGSFEGLLVVAFEGGVRVRVQLFPELGGKLLDVTADADRVVAWMPQGGRPVDADWSRGPAPGLPTLLAIDLLERFAPIAPSRVLGARELAGGFELRLAPIVAGSEVSATVDAGGRVIERRLAWRGAAWRSTADRVTARGFELSIDVQSNTRLDEVSPEVFAPLAGAPR